MTIRVLTHVDVDGFASAALLVAHLSGPAGQSEGGTGDEFLKIPVEFADYPDIAGSLANNARLSKTLFICDLSVGEVPEEVCREVVVGGDVHFFDHHRMGNDLRGWMSEHCGTFVHVEGGICTARLILTHFCMTDPSHVLLAAAAQGTDYEGTVSDDEEKLGIALERAINPDSGLDGEDTVYLLAMGPVEPWYRGHALVGSLRDASERVLSMQKEKMKGLDLSLHVIKREMQRPLRIACGLFPTVFYPKDGGRVLRQRRPEADICFAFYESMAVLARSRAGLTEASVPLLPFLRMKKGGGRNNNGGFRYRDGATTEANYDERRDALVDDLREFLVQSQGEGRSVSPS